MDKPNEAQQERIQKHWSRIAGEEVEIHCMAGAIYGFCSELGARRLKGKTQQSGIVDYSQPCESWFFRTETSIEKGEGWK